MPRRNIQHDIAKAALIADGWKVIADPLVLFCGSRQLYADLGLEDAGLVVEKAARRIAVEIHSFLNPSLITDVERAIGQ